MLSEIKMHGTSTIFFPDKQLAPGQMVGRYRVIADLGVGGMGEVYLARDPWLQRDVALKVLPEVGARDPKMRARFEQEAQVLAKLDHPNIAAIHDLEQFAQGRCLVMEYVNGETLEERLHRGPLPVAPALRVFLQLARALEAAHREGILHRDLKPANIKITPAGEIKVLDFGIAKILHEEPPTADLSASAEFRRNTRREATFTDPGLVIGTVPYMSPEQTRGETIDLRADLWAFGCLMFETLTGRPAFDGEGQFAVIAAINQDEPDWQALPAGTPPAVHALLRQCLQKDPAKRLASAAEARLRLEKLRESLKKKTDIVRVPPIDVPSPSEKFRRLSRPRRYVTPLLILLVILLALLLAREWYVQWRLTPSLKVLSVVAFQELNASEENVFGRGLARHAGAELARVPGLQVVTNVTPAADTRTDWIVNNLGATLVLRANVHRTDSGARIDYRLHNVRDALIASGSVSRGDLFSAVNQMAAEIARALGLRYPEPGGLAAAPTQQDRYLLALGQLAANPTADSVTRAIDALGAILNTPGENRAIYHAVLARACLAKYSLSAEPAWLEQARNACDTAQALDQHNHQVQVTLGSLNRELGRPREAIGNFNQALRQQPDRVDAKLGLALAYADTSQGLPPGEAAKMDRDAEQAFREAIHLLPGYWVGYNEFGGFYFSRGRFAEAAREWQQVARLLPSSDAGFTNLGNAWLNLGRFDEAIAAYRQSLILRQTPEGHASLGTALYFKGDYQGAIEAYLSGLRLAPDNPTLIGRLGDAYRQASKLTEAEAAYTKAIETWRTQLPVDANGEVTDAEGLGRLADCLAKRGQTTEAFAALRRAVALAPQNPRVSYNAIIVHLSSGNRDAAERWAAWAVQNGYNRNLLRRDPQLAGLPIRE